MIGKFQAPFDASAGRPLLPSESDDGYSIDGDGVVGHGYVTCSYTPTGGTCIVKINTTEAVIDGMDDDDRWEWLSNED